MPPAFMQRQIRLDEFAVVSLFPRYDPVPALQQGKCPVLALKRQEDLQVPPKKSAAD